MIYDLRSKIIVQYYTACWQLETQQPKNDSGKGLRDLTVKKGNLQDNENLFRTIF